MILDLYNFDRIQIFSEPFDHWIIDDFLDLEIARKLSNEFIDFDSSNDIVHYQGWIGDKKSCNVWNRFPPLTYKVFFDLLSSEFLFNISNITNISTLYPDIGLHGGGWHMHKDGGSLAVHLDYSVHPKVNLQRKLNLIIYLEENYNPSWGGSLQLWSHDKENNRPLKMIKEIEPKFNRALLFDTTQNSWHGFPDPIKIPNNKIRKSIAVYYLTDLDLNIEKRYKAQYEKI